MYHFKQAVHLKGKDYKRGSHDVSTEVEQDPFFLKLVHAGLVDEVDSAKELKQETVQERSQRLYEKLAPKKETAPKKKKG
jgi:hypothetical protein